MNDNQDDENNSETTVSEVSTIGDTIGDLITGIPAPVRKNALKAFGQLCTAAVDYPVALIEGAIAEKKRKQMHGSN